MVEINRNLVNSCVRRDRGGCGGSCTCWKPAPQFAGLDLFGRVQNENFVYMMFFLEGQFFLVLFPVTCTCPVCPHHKVKCTGSRAGFTELPHRFSRRWNEPPEKICWRFVYVIVVSAMLIKPMAVLRSGSKNPSFIGGFAMSRKGWKGADRTRKASLQKRELCERHLSGLFWKTPSTFAGAHSFAYFNLLIWCISKGSWWIELLISYCQDSSLGFRARYLAPFHISLGWEATRLPVWFRGHSTYFHVYSEVPIWKFSTRVLHNANNAPRHALVFRSFESKHWKSLF